MNKSEIKEVKLKGETEALKTQIDVRIFELCRNVWHDIVRDNAYYRLGDAIETTRKLVDDIETLLFALQEIEPENK